MKHIRNVPWKVGDIVPDFELGKTTCALYLRSAFSSSTSIQEPLVVPIVALGRESC